MISDLLTHNPFKSMKDGFYWSPDGGHFEKRNNNIYWKDGEFWDESKQTGVILRLGSQYDERPESEWFSKWSDEKRDSVWQDTLRKRAEYQAQQEEREKEIEATVNRVKPLISELEWDDLAEYFRYR